MASLERVPNSLPMYCGLLNTSEGIILSGSPGTLNYYEEYTLSTTVGGIWAAPQNCTLNIVKVGKQVTLEIIASGSSTITATANTAAKIMLTAVIPSRFCPSQEITCTVGIEDNGTWLAGLALMSSSGSLAISTLSQGSFAGSGTSGLACFGMSYTTQ